MDTLEGHVAFITGAARGQGRAEAVKLAQLGADIIAVDLCQQLATIPYGMAVPEDLDETVRLVEETGRRIVARQADVRDLAQLEAVLKDGVEQLGRLDIVVANAGVWGSAHAVDMPLAMYHDVIDVLLHGAYYTCRAAIPHLIAGGRGGSIIIISSTSSTRGAPRQVAYNIAKAGQTGLMVSLANELAEHSIRVNTVNPSATLTPMIDNDAVAQAFAPDAVNPTVQEFGHLFTTLNLLPTPWCQPEDIANAVAWLATSDSRYVTGIQLPVDAGYLAHF
jgi:SDR family mycofactocin-dependent oxidoreductase